MLRGAPQGLLWIDRSRRAEVDGGLRRVVALFVLGLDRGAVFNPDVRTAHA